MFIASKQANKTVKTLLVAFCMDQKKAKAHAQKYGKKNKKDRFMRKMMSSSSREEKKGKEEKDETETTDDEKMPSSLETKLRWQFELDNLQTQASQSGNIHQRMHMSAMSGVNSHGRVATPQFAEHWEDLQDRIQTKKRRNIFTLNALGSSSRVPKGPIFSTTRRHRQKERRS